MVNKIKTLFSLLKVEPIQSRDELAEVCKQTAVIQLQRDTITLQKDAELQALNDRYEGQIEAYQREIDGNVKRIEAWSKDHKETEFGDKQSIFVHGHELRFRKSPEAVGFVDGVKADDLVEAILALPDEGEGNEGNAKLKETLLRVKAELDKNAAKREWNLNAETRAKLEGMGMKLVTKEVFEFVPSREAINTIEAAPADRKDAA